MMLIPCKDDSLNCFKEILLTPYQTAIVAPRFLIEVGAKTFGDGLSHDASGVGLPLFQTGRPDVGRATRRLPS